MSDFPDFKSIFRLDGKVAIVTGGTEFLNTRLENRKSDLNLGPRF